MTPGIKGLTLRTCLFVTVLVHFVGLSSRVSYVRVAAYTLKFLMLDYLFGRTTHGVVPQVRSHGLEIVYYEKDSIGVDIIKDN